MERTQENPNDSSVVPWMVMECLEMSCSMNSAVVVQAQALLRECKRIADFPFSSSCGCNHSQITHLTDAKVNQISQGDPNIVSRFLIILLEINPVKTMSCFKM